MNKLILKYAILLSLLLCLIPGEALADDTATGSFTVSGTWTIDLAVGTPTYTSLTLTWRAPQPISGCGEQAIQYDIRYSLFPISTDAEWNAATKLANPPIPKPPGSLETLMVIGLRPCTTYYFAIKALDECGNWTPLSNSPNGKTLCPPGSATGGGFGLPASFYACPVTLAANMQGNITTVSMTRDGVLCEACLAKDNAEDTLELDKDTKVTLAGNVVPALVKFSIASTAPPTPEYTVIVGPVYEVNAYSSTLGTTPSPINITPAARLILNYDPDNLPENTTEVFIATYSTEQGWQPLEPVPGAVAEVGKVHGIVSHFSVFAVLAKVAGPPPAKFEVSNLTIEPGQVELNQEITISFDVSNTGEESEDFGAELKVDGAVKSSTQVTVAAGATQPVTFNITGDTAGRHQVEVAGLIGEFEVVIPAGKSTINWWLIGSIIGITLVVVIWAIIGWRYYKDRKSRKKTTDRADKKSRKSK